MSKDPPRRRPARAITAAISVLLTMAGCVDLAPDKPPARTLLRVPLPDVQAAPAGGPILRLQPVVPADQLGQRVMYREPGLKAGFYDAVRWLEDPAAVVENALVRTLFEGKGLRQATHGLTPTLTVHLDAFEEDRTQQPPAALISMQATLARADGTSLLVQTYRASAPRQGEDPSELGAAMGRALADACKQLSDDVAAALR